MGAICSRSVVRFSGSCISPAGSLLYYNKVLLPCKSWQCPDCAPKQVKVLRSRVFNGDLQNQFNPDNPYACKFLTLTFPGNEPRLKGYDSLGNPIYTKVIRPEYTPEQALKLMQEAFNRLITAMRKKLGKLHYFRIVEPQKDGFPHFHVLFIGDNIAYKGILDYIKALWWDKYEMGFVWVTARAKKIKSFVHAARYITKYLTKGMISIKKYSRIFSSSRGALMKKIKQEKEWITKRLYFGSTDENGEIKEVEITDRESFYKVIGNYAEAKLIEDNLIQKIKQGVKLCV